MGCLYKIEFPNGKAYVGITVNAAEDRLRAHGYPKSRTAVASAIRKYGKRAILQRTLVIADSREYLCELERKAIAAYGTKAPFGYNMTDGGEGVSGYVYTDEDRAKMSAANKGNKSCVGRKLSEATKEKLRQANLGKKMLPHVMEILRKANTGRQPTEATRAKLSAAQKGNKKGLGSHRTEDAKARIGAAHRGKIVSAETKLRMSVSAKERCVRNRAQVISLAQRMRGAKSEVNERKRA